MISPSNVELTALVRSMTYIGGLNQFSAIKTNITPTQNLLEKKTFFHSISMNMFKHVST